MKVAAVIALQMCNFAAVQISDLLTCCMAQIVDIRHVVQIGPCRSICDLRTCNVATSSALCLCVIFLNLYV